MRRHFSKMDDDKPEKKTDYGKLIRKMAPLLWPEQLNLKVRACSQQADAGGAAIACQIVALCHGSECWFAGKKGQGAELELLCLSPCKRSSCLV